VGGYSSGGFTFGEIFIALISSLLSVIDCSFNIYEGFGSDYGIFILEEVWTSVVSSFAPSSFIVKGAANVTATGFTSSIRGEVCYSLTSFLGGST
jgi:hypothetical protein